MIAYLVAIPLAFVTPWASIAIYVANAVIWFIPDRRIESRPSCCDCSRPADDRRHAGDHQGGEL